MGIGASIQGPDGKEIATVSAVRGEGTNNMAEYQAAIEGLEEARKHDTVEVELRLDSQLVARQLTGEYRVKEPHIKRLWTQTRKLLDSFQKWTVVHVRREENSRADELANMALDGTQLSLDSAETEAANRILAIFKGSSINPSRYRVVFQEVERLLRINSSAKG